MSKTKTMLASIIFLGLAACSDMGTDNASSHSMDNTGTSSSPATGPDTVTMPSGQSSQNTSTTMASNSGVVQTIDMVPRAPATGIGGSVGGAAVGGNVGATSGASASDKVYRISLRLDDGSTQTIIQDAQSNFQPGDRVHMDNGAVTPN